MNVQFKWCGLLFEVECDFEPYIPARLSGPPERCSPAEGGIAEITALTCDGQDASFLLQSPEICSDLEELAYEACEAQIKRAVDEAAYDRYEDRRAA